MSKNKIVWFWNLIHYYLYTFQNFAHTIFNRFNPFFWIYKMTISKGGNITKDTTNIDILVFKNPESGVSSIYAGMQMGIILVLLEYSLFNFIQAILKKSLIQNIWDTEVHKILFIIILLVPPGVFNYLVLFKKNRYLDYFKEFDSMPLKSRKKYCWISLAFVLLTFLIVIISFIFFGESVE